MGSCQTIRERINTTYTPIHNNLLSLMMANRTEDCLDIMRENQQINYSEPVNNFGDNLLHYACKKNNI